MTENKMDLLKLAIPFDASEIKQRKGSHNMTFDYIDARSVQNRLDDVCGPENWQVEFRPIEGGFMAGIGIWFEDRGWVWKWDVADDTQIEATKGGASSAFKRAAVQWGIGRHLYDPSSKPSGKQTNKPQQGQAPKATGPAWSVAQKAAALINGPNTANKDAVDWLNRTGFKQDKFTPDQITKLVNAYLNTYSDIGTTTHPDEVMRVAIASLVNK